MSSLLMSQQKNGGAVVVLGLAHCRSRGRGGGGGSGVESAVDQHQVAVWTLVIRLCVSTKVADRFGLANSAVNQGILERVRKILMRQC